MPPAMLRRQTLNLMAPPSALQVGWMERCRTCLSWILETVLFTGPPAGPPTITASATAF